MKRGNRRVTARYAQSGKACTCMWRGVTSSQFQMTTSVLRGAPYLRRMSWYIVIKTIKGHRYRYRQRTWREGGRMRTKSEYIGAVGEENRSARSRVGLEQAAASGRHRDLEHRFSRAGDRDGNGARRVRRRANGVSES